MKKSNSEEIQGADVGDALPAVGDTPHFCGGAATTHVGDALPASRKLHDGHRPVPPQVERVRWRYLGGCRRRRRRRRRRIYFQIELKIKNKKGPPNKSREFCSAKMCFYKKVFSVFWISQCIAIVSDCCFGIGFVNVDLNILISKTVSFFSETTFLVAGFLTFFLIFLLGLSSNHIHKSNKSNNTIAPKKQQIIAIAANPDILLIKRAVCNASLTISQLRPEKLV